MQTDTESHLLLAPRTTLHGDLLPKDTISDSVLPLLLPLSGSPEHTNPAKSLQLSSQDCWLRTQPYPSPVSRSEATSPQPQGQSQMLV